MYFPWFDTASLFHTDVTRTDVNTLLSKVRPKAWIKPFVLLRCAQRFVKIRHFVWLDADIHILQTRWAVGYVLQRAYRHELTFMHDIVVGEDVGWYKPWVKYTPGDCEQLMNTGIMFVRNTNLSIHVLTQLLRTSSAYANACNWEQAALSDMYLLDMRVRNATHIAKRLPLQGFARNASERVAIMQGRVWSVHFTSSHMSLNKMHAFIEQWTLRHKQIS